MRNRSNRTDGVTGLEQLESRRLLSASITDGVLVVEGTQQSDEVTLRLNHDDTSVLEVSINGDTTQFAVADITGGVSIDTGNGKDHILISDSEGDISLNVTVTAGNGRDLIRGGSENDELFGGNGKDLMYGGAGDDTCVGGNGNDDLNGEVGDDVLHGGRGNDLLNGGDGDDDLDGGKGGNDSNEGGDGNDDFGSHEKSKELKDTTSDDDGDNATEFETD